MTEVVHVIAGPTASGKSALAIERAQQMDGAIINADALQIYDALPILTARPSAGDQTLAPHKLYGSTPPDSACSAADWARQAVNAIAETLHAGQTPIVVGGTGLYLKTLIQGLSDIPDIPAEIRTRLIEKQRLMGNPAFHQALKAVDPIMAARLHPNDTQRLIRAWEVWEGTGESLSVWQSRAPVPLRQDWRFHITIIDLDRDILYARCNQRFERMMVGGALSEVGELMNLIAQGQALAQGGATQALGFRPLEAHLRGDMPLDQAIERAQTDTRQYAKRQVTWLRHQIVPMENIISLTRL